MCEGNAQWRNLTRSLLACLFGEEEALKSGRHLGEGGPGACDEDKERIVVDCRIYRFEMSSMMDS